MCVCVCQAGFEKMEVTGRLELPEELLDLERSGILEAAAFDRSRARRGNTTAPSPPLGPQDPLRTTSAQGDYGLDDDTSRCVHHLVLYVAMAVRLQHCTFCVMNI